MSSSGISWAVCKSAPRSRQITTPAPPHPRSVFYRPDANSVKALKAYLLTPKTKKLCKQQSSNKKINNSLQGHSQLSRSRSEQVSSWQCNLTSTWVDPTHLHIGIWRRLSLRLYILALYWWISTTALRWTLRQTDFRSLTGKRGNLIIFHFRFL